MTNPFSSFIDAAKWLFTPVDKKVAILVENGNKAEDRGVSLLATRNPAYRKQAHEAFCEASNHYNSAGKLEPSESRSFYYLATSVRLYIQGGGTYVSRGP